MEITLEKIELVKDRTGVTYKEAKEALEEANGNVVDAIIAIEEAVDLKENKTIGKKSEELIAKMKEIVKKGNISKIVVTKDNETLINIPLSVGVLGTFVAPWGMIAGVVAAFGFKCQIHFYKDDGSIIDLTEKAEDIYEEAKDKGFEVYDDLKEKAPGVYDDIMEKGTKTFYTIKEKFKEKKKDVEEEMDFGQHEDDSCSEGCCSDCDCGQFQGESDKKEI